MGCVYMLERAYPAYESSSRKARFGKWLALKTFLMAEDDADSFRNELNVWIDLAVPHVVPLLSVTRIDGQLCAVMPLYACSLDDALLPNSPISCLRAISVILSAIRCLSLAYEQHGVLHLDLKPGNLLLKERDDTVVDVGDWGIARIVNKPFRLMRARKWKSANLFETRLAAGTLPYMSPERILGMTPTVQDDIYSLGLILCQLLCGHLPLSGGTEYALVASILSGCTHNAEFLLHGNSMPLIRIVLQCLARNRHDRYQDYHSLVQDFKEVQNGLI